MEIKSTQIYRKYPYMSIDISAQRWYGRGTGREGTDCHDLFGVSQ